MKYSFFFSSFLMIGSFIQCNTFENRVEKGKNGKIARPNVLFLFSDDQRADALGCSGNSYIKTPNIDKLAENGIRFTNSYIMGATQPAVCAPSRAMLMSGKSLFHIYDILDGVTTMPMYFGQNGYETFGTGKWHNGAKTFEASFQMGKDVLIGGGSNHFKVPCHDMGINGKLVATVTKGFSTDVFADAAIGFLKDYAQRKQGIPFFCYLAFTAPHDPRSPREDYIGMYPDESIPVPGNFKKYHPFAFDDMQIRDENLAPWPRSPEIIQASLAEYYSLISHIDNRVGDIIEVLKCKGLFENTLIIYSSDNGLAIGSHGLLGKQNIYEHSTKVPLIISGPGIPCNKVSDAFVYLFDLFPTLCRLCNLPAPDSIDGKDITPVIQGDSEGIRSSLFTAYRNTARGVRTNEWKMIHYPDRGYTQLFNLKNDPLEINNLASLPDYNQKVNEMMDLLAVWQKKVDDPYPLNAKNILPFEYDPTKFVQKTDNHQPEYTLKKYFEGVDWSIKWMGNKSLELVP